MTYRKSDIKTPEFAYELVTLWRNQENWPKNFGVLVSLAIDHYDKIISKMSEEELEKLNKENIKLIHKWQEQGLIDPKARGVPNNMRVAS